MRPVLPRQRVWLLIFCIALVLPLVAHRRASAQHIPIRLAVNKWKVEAGDNYTLSWMESGTVQPMSDFVVEEDSDPQFKDKDNYSRYVVRAHRKAFENSTSFSHTVRYYRVRARAWVRNDDDQQVEDEVVSNTVRVTLLGTDKSAAPSFPDDPEEAPVKPKKKDPKDRTPEEQYPAMGRPDFVIQKIALEPASPKINQPFRVRVTIRNVGVVPSDSVQVKIEAAGRQYVVDCEPLKPNYAVDVQSPPITTDKPGPITVTAVADPFERVAESREDNNSKSSGFTIADEAPKTPTGSQGSSGTSSSGGK